MMQIKFNFNDFVFYGVCLPQLGSVPAAYLGINTPVIIQFSSSLHNAYSSGELNGLLYCQNSIFFQLQGGEAP